MNLITSRSNPKIKFVRNLRQRKYRQETGLLVVEGIHHIGQAIEAAAEQENGPVIDSLYYAPELLTSEYALKLIESAARSGISCLGVSAQVFDSISGKENPQGILALARLPKCHMTGLSPENFPWGVALVCPQDPGNIGAILRTVDAVGASGMLLLDESADPTHPNAVRASMGALFWHPVVQASFAEFAAWSSQHRYHVYGTSAHGSELYQSLRSYDRPMILLLGSEREGLTPDQAAHCQHLLRLPMHGRVSSLNLAVAAGIMLYEMLSG